MTNASPAQTLVYLFRALGLVNISTAWPAVVGSKPTTPDNLVVVYDTAGVVDGRIQRTGEIVTHDGVQVVVRSLDYLTGWNKGKALLAALASVESVTVTLPVVGTVMVHSFALSSPLAKFGQEEENNRILFSFNGTVAIS